jgi:hypothetical protein
MSRVVARERFADRVQDSVDLTKDLPITKADDLKAARFQEIGPREIGLLSRWRAVLAPIEFDNQSMFQADEIREIRAERNLPSKVAPLNR